MKADVTVAPERTAWASFGVGGYRYTVAFQPKSEGSSRMHITDGFYVRWPHIREDLGYVAEESEKGPWLRRFTAAVHALAREVLDGLARQGLLPAEAAGLRVTHDRAPECYCGCVGPEVALGTTVADVSGTPLDLYVVVTR